MGTYAGKYQVEGFANRHGEEVPAQAQAGGDMAVKGTEADGSNSSGRLSEKGKEVWREGVVARGSDVKEKPKRF